MNDDAEITKLKIRITRLESLLKVIRRQLVQAQRQRLQDAGNTELLRDQIDDAFKNEERQ